MISEKRFADEYNSFWQQLLPFSERYVRSMNHFQFTFGEEVIFEGNGGIRAFVAEMAFCLSSWAVQGRDVFNPEGLREAYKTAEDYFGTVLGGGLVITQAHVEAALLMATASSEKLKSLVVDPNVAEFRPKFDGCGLIGKCEGDLQVHGVLIEFKSVSRGFRSTDYRQLITYLALNSAAQAPAIEQVILLNARRLTYVSVDVESMLQDMSGRPSLEVIQAVIDFITNEELHVVEGC